MKMTKVTSVEDYKIVSSFQSLRKTLLDDRFADRLEKPLAYWALPNDRRLPLAFLGRTIKDLLATPFEELSATPGIGQKKISSLVRLLSRATKDEPPSVPFGLTELADGGKKAESVPKLSPPATQFDPSVVSEALWSQWQNSVIEHGVGHEKLGRLATSLRSLPTVIWHTRLSNYAHRTLAEIRQLKTHGEKRVRVVLEVFYLVHEMLSGKHTDSHLALRIVPKFIEPIEEWVFETLERPGVPVHSEVRDRLAIPLLEQVKIDAGETIHELSAQRVGLNGPPRSVREQARQMEVTRARVYQLLEDCSRVIQVRWPEGEHWLAQLNAKFAAEATSSDDLRLFRAVKDLFYPDRDNPSEDEAEVGLADGG